MNKLITLLTVAAVASMSYGMSSPTEKKAQTHSVKHEQVYVKPHAGIGLNYNQPKNLQAGDSFELVLNFKTQVNADSLQVNIKHDDALQLGVSQFDYQFSAVKNEQNKIVIPFTALQDGRFFIDVSAALITDGKKQTRSFSIPVTVGDISNIKTKAKPGYKAMPEQGVISMPATETTD